MKTFKFLFAISVISLLMVSCYDMDLEPTGLIYENVLLNSDDGIMRYFAQVYQDLPIEDFNYKQNGDSKGYATVNSAGWHTGNKWEAQKGSPAAAAQEAAGRDPSYGTGWGYWPYERIRDINNFIEKIPDYADNYTEEEYQAYLSEAYFLRAFYYFGLVKRYGGVPIVKEVLDPTADLEELQQPRDTEYDCWKFIYEDLKYAMENGSSSRSEVCRANRYAAAALMSRTMLYAGSIAKYGGYITTTGPAVTAGLMSISADKAEEFFQYAYDACKFLKDAGFTLHNSGNDKVANYIDVFLGDNRDDEDIFIKQYGSYSSIPANTSLFHCWDTMVLPKGEGLANDVGASLQPVWELIKLYELPAVTDENGYPVRFDDVTEIWNNGEMEPRCQANFFFPGMTEPVSGAVMDIQGGVYTSYPGTAADGTTEVTNSASSYTDQYRIRASNPGTTQTISGVTLQVNGTNGLAEGVGDEGYTYTGTFIRKYVDNTGNYSTRVLFGSQQPWKVFRYGEILCNWAEAAYELGLIQNNDELKREAFEHINELRERAGAHTHEMVDSPEDVGSSIYGFEIDENLQYIRDERARELCLENQRLFDLRRWRVADMMFLDGKYSHTLLPYYVLDEGKYIFLNEVDIQGRKVTFDRAWYYEPIPEGEINKNPNLVRNDGY